MLSSLSNAEKGYQGITLESMLQNSVTCGLLVIDTTGTVVALTPEAQRLLNLPAAQIQTLSFQQLPPPVQSVIREVQKFGKVVADRHIVLPPHNSGGTAVTLTALPFAAGNQNGGTVVMLKSVSSVVRFEENLRRLDRLAAVGTLSASMAHEIKNALVAVKTFIDLLLEKHQDNELVGVVRREMDRVDSMVSHMLKFSAPAQPAFSPVRLHELLDHSLRLVHHRVENKVISFIREFNATSDAFRGDNHQLEQAFVNLLFNAVDAMKSEGTLTISTDLVADESRSQLNDGNDLPKLLRVKIRDTGIGIPADNMSHIFAPFFTTKEDGTGLGLAVTRRIIEEHSGTIFVESHPGKGTTFVILVPAGAEAPSP